MYPIPDDVTPIKSEEIVRYARCEMRAAIIARILENKEVKKLVPPLATEADVVKAVNEIKTIVEAWQKENKKRVDEGKKTIALKDRLKAPAGREIKKYMDVVVVYEFEFEITEQNHANGGLAFKLPLVSSVIDVDSSASLLLTRKGKRTFKAQDRWTGLVTVEERCKDFSVMRRNVIYPLGGSIGVGRVVTTFMDLVDQGGSKDSFVDALIFTTEVGGGVNATIKLSPVSHSFRLVSADAHLSGSRLDVHKLTLSLVFPKQDSPEAIYGVDRFDGDLNAPFDRPADWRARYNLCVADARAREDALNALRQTAPEIYCIQYADAFDPQYGASRTKEKAVEVKAKAKSKAAPQPSFAPPRRENYAPN